MRRKLGVNSIRDHPFWGKRTETTFSTFDTRGEDRVTAYKRIPRVEGLQGMIYRLKLIWKPQRQTPFVKIIQIGCLEQANGTDALVDNEIGKF